MILNGYLRDGHLDPWFGPGLESIILEDYRTVGDCKLVYKVVLYW
jgi:hypothetical protein